MKSAQALNMNTNAIIDGGKNVLDPNGDNTALGAGGYSANSQLQMGIKIF